MFPDSQGVRLRLNAYLELLLQWNQHINLISRKERAPEIHFIDSLHFATALPPNAIVADIGTGAGFPGMIVALARPDVRVTLVEPTQKKQSFLRTVRDHFQLTTIQLRVARLENGMLRDTRTSRLVREKWEHVVCKALSDPETFRQMVGSCARTLWFLASLEQAQHASSAWKEHHRWTVTGERIRVLLYLAYPTPLQ